MNIKQKVGISISSIKVGMEEIYSQTITDADIKAFAGISGDNNPVHMSDKYAEATKYKKRIAHGLLSASFFSSLFGTRLPGPGCVYVQQNLNFKRPVYINDTVTASIVVTSVDTKRNRVFFDTVARVSGKVVIDGVAEIYIPNK